MCACCLPHGTVTSMRLTHLVAAAGLTLAVTACVPETGGGTSTTTTPGSTTTAPATTTTAAPTTTTTTTVAPLPTLTYTGVADKTAGCFSGLGGNDDEQVTLGTDGWWYFGFQGCSLGSTETVALIDPAGGPSADAFKAPTGYQCKLEIVGTADSTAYFTDKVSSGADTGGLIFLSSSSAWPNTSTWQITCAPV